MTERTGSGRGRQAMAALLVVGAGVLAGVLTLASVVWLTSGCVPGYSEAIILAPESWRGRVACTVTEDGDIAARLGILPAIGLLVLAALVWAVRRWSRLRALRALVLPLALAVVAPLVVVLGVALLPADCSQAAWDEHGAAGCERSEEERPGLGVR